MTFLMVAVGGALGSVARYGVSVSMSRWIGNPVPHATAIVNVLGCAVAGVLLGFTAGGRITLTLDQRAFLFSGVLGGLTTFSGLGMDTLLLVEQGRTVASIVNIAVQLAAGLTVLALGYMVAKA